MKPLHVAHLMGSLQPSGMERMFLSAAQYFICPEVRSTIVAQGRNQPFASELRAAGYDVLVIPAVKTVSGARAYGATLRSLKPDVIHIHTEGGFVISTVIARLARPSAPIVRTIHNVFQSQGRALLSRKAQSFIADRCISSFIAPSPDVAENEQAFGRSVTTIFNWIDNSYAQPLAETVQRLPKTAVLVGNCSPSKNHELALRAVLENGFTLYHHGNELSASPEERRTLDELAERGQLAYRGVGDPAHSLQQAEVFLMPSRREGMGVALAEAIAAGTPAVVADVDGLKWTHGIPRVVHLPLDPDAWIRALRSAPYKKVSGTVRAPDFTAQRGAGEYAAIYRQVMRHAATDAVPSRDTDP